MFKRLMVFLLTLVLVLSACAPKAPPALQPVTIRLAALRILDSLPLLVAEEQGYFAAGGIQVEVIPVASAPERDQLIAAGQADGMITEMHSTLLANRQQTTLQVVRFARAATSGSPVFRVVAAKDSGIVTLDDLQPVETGISEGTIIQYVFERLIAAEGKDPGLFGTVNIPSIPERLKLLGAGELQAAVLPDPAASLAVLQGAMVVVDDSSHPEYGYSVLTFRSAFLDQNPDALKAFLEAWEKAVADINADPNRWKALLTEKEILPLPLADSYQVPAFVTAGVPSESQFADALDWVQAKGLLDKDLAYQDVVTDAFLP
ncbi:MAG: ABC transporter substrate-binding protein [Chloroflexota bacterium]